MTFSWKQSFSILKSDIWPCRCISGQHHMAPSAICFWFQVSLLTPSHLTAISWSGPGIPAVSQQAARWQMPSTIFRVCLLNTEANRNPVAWFCLPLESWLPSHHKTSASQREHVLNLQGLAFWFHTCLCWKWKYILNKEILKFLKYILHNLNKMWLTFNIHAIILLLQLKNNSQNTALPESPRKILFVSPFSDSFDVGSKINTLLCLILLHKRIHKNEMCSKFLEKNVAMQAANLFNVKL